MNPGLRDCWEASYRSHKGNPFNILGTGTNECPVSLLLSKFPESIELVESYARAAIMHNAVGATPYGGDLHEWPARLVDAYIVLNQEESRVEALMVK